MSNKICIDRIYALCTSGRVDFCTTFFVFMYFFIDNKGYNFYTFISPYTVIIFHVFQFEMAKHQCQTLAY